MTSLAILTPSYRPDLAGFRRLHASVLQHTDDAVLHHVIVPGIDAHLYRAIDSPRLVVWTYRDVLPRGITPTDRLAVAMKRIPGIPSSLNCAAVNWRRPWKPVRGWVLQQVVKMCMAELVDADVFVNIDSDVVLVRPLRPEAFLRNGVVRLYGREDAIRPDMRHYRWSETAHELLGLPWDRDGTFPDHIAGLVSWDVGLLRACLRRIEEASGMHWAAAVAEQLQFSEDILYGTYVRNFGSPTDRSFQRETTMCHSYWKAETMGPVEADEFVAGFGDEHLAVHIQSNTETDPAIFHEVVERISRTARA